MKIDKTISEELEALGAHIYAQFGASKEAFGLIESVEDQTVRGELLMGAYLAIDAANVGDGAAYNYKYWKNLWRKQEGLSFDVMHANAYQFSCQIINAAAYPKQTGVDAAYAGELLRDVAGEQYRRAVKDGIKISARTAEDRKFYMKTLNRPNLTDDAPTAGLFGKVVQEPKNVDELNKLGQKAYEDLLVKLGDMQLKQGDFYLTDDDIDLGAELEIGPKAFDGDSYGDDNNPLGGEIREIG